MPADLRLDLFGAPRLTRDGSEIALPTRKLLALLAWLAFERRATRAKVAALFWADSDPEAARRNLRRELHRLREAGLGDVVEGEGDTLKLAAACTSDVAEFEAALQRDDVPAALAAYRGPLLDGFDLSESGTFDDWLASQRETSAQRWRRTLVQWAARQEAGSDLRGALASYHRLLADDPLQESHYASAMRLHYALGERAQALELFDRCRRTLHHELGLDPLPETTALAERIRATERVAPLVAATEGQGLAHLAPPLVARGAELEALATCRTPVALVTGDAGVGKTRLVHEFTSKLPACVRIRCESFAADVPLYPLAEALRRLVETPAGRARLDALSAPVRREVARVLPEVDAAIPGGGDDRRGSDRRRADDALGSKDGHGGARGDRPGRRATDRAGASTPNNAAARSQFFDGLCAALLAFADGGVVWIDDLHWADAATLELADRLAHRAAREDGAREVGREAAPGATGNAARDRGEPAPRLRLLLTARDHELADRIETRDAARKLERAGLVTRVALAPLAADDTLALVRALSGSEQGGLFSTRLHRVTHGNPFFLLETIRFLFDSGDLALDEAGRWTSRYDTDTSDYMELPVPPSVQQAIVERVDRLGPATRRVLEAAALTAEGFTLAEVQPATALGEFEALDGIERAVEAQLLAAGPAPSYRFVHDLARSALADRLGTDRRQLIHARLAQALETQRTRPERIAYHWTQAGRAAQAVPWHIAAAHAAERVFALREALAHYAAALAATTEPSLRLELQRARIELTRRLLDITALAAEVEAFTVIAESAADDVARVEALSWRAYAANQARRHEEALRHAHAAAALAAYRDAPMPVRFRVRAETAQALNDLGRYDETAAVYAEDLRDPTQFDPPRRAALYFAVAHLAVSRNRNAEAKAPLEESLALYEASGHIEGAARTMGLLAYLQHTGGDTAAATATLERALAATERAGLVLEQWGLLTNLVKLHVSSHRLAEAEECLARGERLLADSSDLAARGRLESRRVEVLQARGDLGGALRAAARSVACYEDNRGGAAEFWPWYQRSRLAWLCGDNDAAVALWRDLPRSPAYLASADDAIRFFTTAFVLPADAPRIAVELERAPAPKTAIYTPDDVVYWRAYALAGAGRAAEALDLMKSLRSTPFSLHAASVLALRLRAQAAAGRDTAALLAEADHALPSAPPLERLELRQAAIAALAAGGDRGGVARHKKALTAEVEALAATLPADKQGAFRRRYTAA